MDDEQRWAKTGLMISAGAHLLIALVVLFAGAIFNAPNDEPIQIMETSFISEEEFAEIVGDQQEQPEPPQDVLAIAAPPDPPEAAEPAFAEPEIVEPEVTEPEVAEPEQPETETAKAPYEVAPPPPPQLTLDPRATRDALPSDEIREALAKPDPEVFKDPEPLKDPQEDQVAEVDFSDRIEQDPCEAAEELRALCAADSGRCAPGSSVADQLFQAETSCREQQERIAEQEREEERLREEQEKERLAEEKRKEEELRKAEDEKKQATRQALRAAIADLKRQAEIKERRLAEARKRREAQRKKQQAAGDDLLAEFSNLDPGGEVRQQQVPRVTGQSAELSAGEKASLAFNFKREWLAPDPESLDVADLIVEFEVQLDRNGNVIGEPKTLSPTGTLTPRQITAIFNAKRAIRLGAPHKGPPEKFGSWQVIHIEYDPRRQEVKIN